MKISEIIEIIKNIKTLDIYGGLKADENVTIPPMGDGRTVDTVKIGDENRDVKKVAVCCIATAEVIKNAKEWGAEFLITHEPTFYDHYDELDENNKLAFEKYELAKNSGMALFRYHDLMHHIKPDIIALGELTKLGWRGNFDGEYMFVLDEAVSPNNLALDIKNKLGLNGIRLVGDGETPIKRILTLFGAWDVPEIMKGVDYDCIICGEVSEWKAGEQIRDAAQMGYHKSMIILGHIASERDGMEYLAGLIKREIPEIEVKYFDSGELYKYL